ncbi:hypothetical protein P2318_05725 [Myxococcaceae bacterium GXIMD 01537]
MRYLYMAAAVVCWSTGCAGIPPALLQAQEREAARWRGQYEEERERSEALAVRLAEAEAALEERAQERAEAEQERALLQDELARAEGERRALEENVAQLRVRQREMVEMHEELSDVWYESALSRARRHLPPRPASTEGEAGSGGGGSR